MRLQAHNVTRKHNFVEKKLFTQVAYIFPSFLNEILIIEIMRGDYKEIKNCRVMNL